MEIRLKLCKMRALAWQEKTIQNRTYRGVGIGEQVTGETKGITNIGR